MKKKRQTAVGIGTPYIECEGTGGALDFKHKPKEKETPEGYFEQKRTNPLFHCYEEWDGEE